MIRSLVSLVGAAAALLFGTIATAQGISVNATITGQVVPGIYGQVVIGDRQPPPVVYAQPVLIAPPPAAVYAAPEPIYLHVPPGHARHWREHCAEYQACNRPVYFVRSAEYEPGYRHHDHDHDHGHGHDEDGDEHGHHGHHGHDHDD